MSAFQQGDKAGTILKTQNKTPEAQIDSCPRLINIKPFGKGVFDNCDVKIRQLDERTAVGKLLWTKDILL